MLHFPILDIIYRCQFDNDQLSFILYSLDQIHFQNADLIICDNQIMENITSTFKC